MEHNENTRTALRRYLRITAGCFLYAMSVSFCLEPWELTPGGITGLAIVVEQWVPLEIGTIMLLLNLPLLWLGWRRFGEKFLKETLYATVVTAILSNGFEQLSRYLPPFHRSIVTAALVGGFLQAVGIGVVFREGATTGGTDIVVHLLHDRYHKISSGILFLTVDTGVILLAALTGFGLRQILFAILALCVFSLTLNWVLRG